MKQSDFDFDAAKLTDKQIDAKLKQLQSLSLRTNAAIRRLETAKAERKSPFGPGDIIERTKMVGYGQNKKPRIEKFRVLAVLPCTWGQPSLRATRIKKDGTDGATVKIYGFDVEQFKRVGREEVDQG